MADDVGFVVYGLSDTGFFVYSYFDRSSAPLPSIYWRHKQISKQISPDGL